MDPYAKDSLVKTNDPSYKMPGYTGFLPGTRLMAGHRPRSAVRRQVEEDRVASRPREAIGQQDPTNAFLTGSFSKANMGDKKHDSMWADEAMLTGPTFGVGKLHMMGSGLGTSAGGDNSLVSNPQRSHMRLGDGRFTEYVSSQHMDIQSPVDSLTTAARIRTHQSANTFNVKYPSREQKAAEYARVAKMVKPATLDKIHTEMLRKMQARINHGTSNLARQFRLFDKDRSGTVDFEEFQAALRAFGFNVGLDETLALFASLDKDVSGHISYQEFCDHMIEGDYEDKRVAATRSSGHVLTQGKTASFGDEHVIEGLKQVSRLKGMSVKQYEENLLVQAKIKYSPLLSRMRLKFFQRLHDLDAAFRTLDSDGDGQMNAEEFAYGLAQCGFKLSPADISSLFLIFDANKSGTVDIDEFIATLDAHKPLDGENPDLY